MEIMKAAAGVFLAENVPLDNRTNWAGFDTFSLVVSIWHETNVYVDYTYTLVGVN